MLKPQANSKNKNIISNNNDNNNNIKIASFASLAYLYFSIRSRFTRILTKFYKNAVNPLRVDVIPI